LKLPSNLALVFLGLVERFRPKYVVWENVPGVHSSWSDVATYPAGEEAGKIIAQVKSLGAQLGIDSIASLGAGDFEEVDQSNDFDSWTTNYFHFVALTYSATNGFNSITLHAVDLAGNTVTTNFSFALDYTYVTNPPALTLIWPQPGALIGGTNFTLQATVDDDTATVVVSIAGSIGVTNSEIGLVERDGNVWADNLPLAAGTNLIKLKAKNAAAAVSITNFVVLQSLAGLTIKPLYNDQLNQSSVTRTSQRDALTIGGTVRMPPLPTAAKAPEGWRTPGRFARSGCLRFTRQRFG